MSKNDLKKLQIELNHSLEQLRDEQRELWVDQKRHNDAVQWRLQQHLQTNQIVINDLKNQVRVVQLEINRIIEKNSVK
jgi:hypothetical protein